MSKIDEIYTESETNARLTVGHASRPGELVAISKRVEQGQEFSWASFSYDGDTATLSVGNQMYGLPGKLVLGSAGANTQSILLDSETNTVALGGKSVGNGTIRLNNRFGTEAVVVSGETATLTLGAAGTASNEVASGMMVLKRNDGTQTIQLDGRTGNLTLGGESQDGDLIITSGTGATTIALNGDAAELALGGSGLNGDVRVKNAKGSETIRLNGEAGNLTLGGGDQDGDLTITNTLGDAAIVMSGSSGAITAGGRGTNGDIIIKNSNDIETIKITGSNGDIEFLNADVAEEFEVHAAYFDEASPGTVMVLGESGRLIPSELPYDSRVAGVVAGAVSFRPGIILDRNGGANRRAIALVGKTYCRVDASNGPIRVGDLLTTSATHGHAMRALDRQQAFGAVLGKALQAWPDGVGLIPILVKLQ